MLKSVKECLKNWLVTHERLYWYIVVGLAVLGFGIVTGMGMAKLEKANAAEVKDFIIPWNGVDTAVSNEGLDYYLIAYGESHSNSGVRVFFSDKPFVGYKMDATNYVIKSANCTLIAYGMSNVADITSSRSDYSNGANCVFDFTSYVSNCGLSDESGNVLLASVEYVPPSEYSSSAPYVSFEKVDVVNPIGSGQTKSTLFQDIYEDYILSSSWTYYGKLNNTNASKDLEYSLDVEFLIEMPTDEFVDDVATDANINLDLTSKFLKYAPDMIEIWNVSGDDGCVEYKVNTTIPLVVDDDGYFHFGFTFPELEYLLHMDENFHSRWVALTSDDNSYWKAVLLSHMHIDTLSMCVKTTQSDAILYGKGVINVFERGIYDACVEIAPDIDFENTTEEELDKIVKEAIDKAYEDYRKDLENRLEQLENQLNSTTSVQSGFGSLDGTDLWTGFQSLSAGLASLAPSISALSVLTGAVFGFMPSPITSIMTFTLFALCVIALIKAIRG